MVNTSGPSPSKKIRKAGRRPKVRKRPAPRRTKSENEAEPKAEDVAEEKAEKDAEKVAEEVVEQAVEEVVEEPKGDADKEAEEMFDEDNIVHEWEEYSDDDEEGFGRGRRYNPWTILPCHIGTFPRRYTHPYIPENWPGWPRWDGRSGR